MVEVATFNVQKVINPKVGKPELWFMCSAHCLTMLYICVKFHENITNCIRVMDRIHGRNGYVQCLEDNNSNSRQARVMVHVFCTSSHGALHFCERS